LFNKLEKLKKKLGKQILNYDRYYNSLGSDGGERITFMVSATLQQKATEILETIEQLKKLELSTNGKIPIGLVQGEKEFKSKFEY